jgi:hypothetical protein
MSLSFETYLENMAHAKLGLIKVLSVPILRLFHLAALPSSSSVLLCYLSLF